MTSWTSQMTPVEGNKNTKSQLNILLNLKFVIYNVQLNTHMVYLIIIQCTVKSLQIQVLRGYHSLQGGFNDIDSKYKQRILTYYVK